MHKTRRKLLAVSVAACALSLPQPGEDNTVRMQLLPAGQFRPQDGRKDGIADTGYWFIDAALASQVIARAKGRATQICIDYEHQTLHKEKNGQPATTSTATLFHCTECCSTIWMSSSVSSDGRSPVARCTPGCWQRHTTP